MSRGGILLQLFWRKTLFITPNQDGIIMATLKAAGHGLFMGMGVICGGGSSYIKSIITRSDEAGIRRDFEAIGHDMWNAVDKVDQAPESSSKRKRELVRG